MKPFNQQLNDDINRLKILHSKKDKTEFNLLKAEIMKRHNISKATVYREMKKDVPGMYKTPQYIPPERPVTEREIELVKTLLEKQYKVQDVCRMLERELGGNYSWDRVDRIREAADLIPLTKGDLGGLENNNSASSLDNPPVWLRAPLVPFSPQAGCSTRGTLEAQDGTNIRAVIEEILGWDMIAEGSEFPLSIGGQEFTISRSAVRDILLIIANYADACGDTIMDMNRMRLGHITTEKIRQLSLGGYVSVKELKELTQMAAANEQAESMYKESTDYVSMLLKRNRESEKSERRRLFYELLYGKDSDAEDSEDESEEDSD